MNIAGINILIKCPFPIDIAEETAPFLYEFEKEEVILEYQEVTEIAVSDIKPIKTIKSRHFINDQVYGQIHLISDLKNHYYAKVYKTAKNRWICEYLKGEESHLRASSGIYYVFGLEDILLEFNALILHASFISYQNKAVLFSAAPGTGKSTQADLWHTYKNAEIINGDRAGIKKENGCWKAYGLPVAGTSGIYKNRTVPLSTIILLEQARENTLLELSATEKYRLLYPEVMIHNWDSEYENKASSLLLEIINETPVYKLKCLPDYGAVETVRNILARRTLCQK